MAVPLFCEQGFFFFLISNLWMQFFYLGHYVRHCLPYSKSSAEVFLFMIVIPPCVSF